MWRRDSARFEELMGDGGAVWEEQASGGNVATAVNHANAALPAGVPWRLTSSGKTRSVIKRDR